MVSIIIVNYHSEIELTNSIRSIYSAVKKIPFEIIVVDNNEGKYRDFLKKKFPKIHYIKNQNRGYGQGNNVGASQARGEFLFFLNPDTILDPECIATLVDYLKSNQEVAIAAPFLYDNDEKKILHQGTSLLNPINAIFAFSFLSRIFPRNKIAKKYWLSASHDSKVKRVSSVPGAAFLIRKEIFEEVKGFDENIFMYFEEQDLCKRVEEMGYKLVMLNKAKVIHLGGRSTKNSQIKSKAIFRKSRFYYFRKHFNFPSAVLAEALLRANKIFFILSLIVILGFLLRIFRLSETMFFIGDQGWYYLSARDMLLSGKIPLVGILSSHPWLHQGALWTYLLSIALWIFHFNPLGGAYLTTFLDSLAIILVYVLAKKISSESVSLTVAFLYAQSPLLILNSRMPYHTTLIPCITLLYALCVYYWLEGKKYAFPIIFFLLGFLYNLELATVLLFLPLCAFFLYGFFRKRQWFENICRPGVIIWSILAFFISMFPILLYDLSHKFVQTLGFIAWIGYRILIALDIKTSSSLNTLHPSSIFNLFLDRYRLLVVPEINFLSLILLIASIIYFIFLAVKNKNSYFVFIILTTIVLLIGIFFTQTSSDAYLPTLYPFLLLILSILLGKMLEQKIFAVLAFSFFLIVLILNIKYLAQSTYFLSSSYNTYERRLTLAKYIVRKSNGIPYNIEGAGDGSKFQNFAKNYEYLTWWLGNGPAHKKEKLVFVICQCGKNEIVWKK